MLLTGDDNREGSSQEYIFEIFLKKHAAESLCADAYDCTSRLRRDGAQDGQEDFEGSSVDGSTLREQELDGAR
jgi:hypothetical protein